MGTKRKREVVRTILAIDPSIRSCGWALFRDKSLRRSGTSISKEPFPEAAYQIVDDLLSTCGCHPWIDSLVIEYPVYEHSLRGKLAATQGHTLSLAFVCGILVGRIRPNHILLATPMQWKGNVPKEVTQARLRAKGYEFKTSDEADAIALGLWAIRKYITSL